MLKSLPVFSLTISLLAGCASQPHETVTTEHKGKTTIIHHRSRVANGSRDRIEAIDSKGVVTQAEIHVYDLGRYVDSIGNIHEAHRLYRTEQSERPNLMLPRHVSGGPRTALTPPNYSPLPQDQRISDAVAEAREAKKKLEDATKQVQDRLQTDNALEGQLQQAQSDNQALQDKLAAAMNTPKKATPTAAEQAAQSSTSDLQKWGASQQQGQ